MTRRRIMDDLSIDTNEAYYEDYSSRPRVSRSAVKKNHWLIISDFFRNSSIPEQTDELLTSAVQECAEWKRYVEQDLDEGEIFYEISEKTPSKESSITTLSSGSSSKDIKIIPKIETKEEVDKRIEEEVKNFKLDSKLYVLSGLIPKGTKSTKDEKFEIKLPEGEGLRRLNNFEGFKIPWDIYSPTVDGERDVFNWTHNLKKNQWVSPKNFQKKDVVDYSTKCNHSKLPCDEKCINRQKQIECNSRNCSFGEEDCGNRFFTNLEKELNEKSNYHTGYEIVKTKDKGESLVAIRPYSSGSLVIEFTGEIITFDEVGRRLQTFYKDSKNFYFLMLTDDYVIDAGRRGSPARFVNHSCDPNCEIQKWYVDGEPRIGLFSKRDVKSGEELCYEYNFELFENCDPEVCHCGSSKCKGYIGKVEQKQKHFGDLTKNNKDLSITKDIENLGAKDPNQKKSETKANNTNKVDSKPKSKPNSPSKARSKSTPLKTPKPVGSIKKPVESTKKPEEPAKAKKVIEPVSSNPDPIIKEPPQTSASRRSKRSAKVIVSDDESEEEEDLKLKPTTRKPNKRDITKKEMIAKIVKSNKSSENDSFEEESESDSSSSFSSSSPSDFEVRPVFDETKTLPNSQKKVPPKEKPKKIFNKSVSAKLTKPPKGSKRPFAKQDFSALKKSKRSADYEGPTSHNDHGYPSVSDDVMANELIHVTQNNEYSEQQYPNEYDQGNYSQDQYDDYPLSKYPKGQNYPQGQYAQEQYPQQSYPPEQYPQGSYPPDQYPPEQYPQGSYPPGVYPPQSYAQEPYPQDQYPQHQYAPDQYTSGQYSQERSTSQYPQYAQTPYRQYEQDNKSYQSSSESYYANQSERNLVLRQPVPPQPRNDQTDWSNDPEVYYQQPARPLNEKYAGRVPYQRQIEAPPPPGGNYRPAPHPSQQPRYQQNPVQPRQYNNYQDYRPTQPKTLAVAPPPPPQQPQAPPPTTSINSPAAPPGVFTLNGDSSGMLTEYLRSPSPVIPEVRVDTAAKVPTDPRRARMLH